MTILHHSILITKRSKILMKIMRIIGGFDETSKEEETLNERYNDIISNYNRFDHAIYLIEIEVKEFA